MFRSQAKRAAERARRSNESDKRWANAIGCEARISLYEDVSDERVKVCLQSSAIDAKGR